MILVPQTPRFRRVFSNTFLGHSELPDLIGFQQESYERFLQRKCDPNKREKIGLEAILSSIFPVENAKTGLKIEYINYEIGTPQNSIEECKLKGYTYSVSITLNVKFYNTKVDEKGVIKSMYFEDIPLMAPDACFIINGIERIVISQLKKSPGVLFCEEKPRGRDSVVSAKIIPYSGSWITFNVDANGIIYFRIDKKKKLLVSTLLMALPRYKYYINPLKANKNDRYYIDKEFRTTDEITEEQPNEIVVVKENNRHYGEGFQLREGFTKEQILSMFYEVDTLSYNTEYPDHWDVPFHPHYFTGIIFKHNIIDKHTKTVVAMAGKAFNATEFNKKKKIKTVIVHEADMPLLYAAHDVIDIEGKVILEAAHPITHKMLKQFVVSNVTEVLVLVIGESKTSLYIRNTVAADKNIDRRDALSSIGRIFNVSDSSNVGIINEYFKGLFFDENNFSFSPLGRRNMNEKLDLKVPNFVLHLTRDDIIATIRRLIEVTAGLYEVDDIDDLGNKKISCVGDIMYDQCALGAKKMIKNLREKISSYESANSEIIDLVNARLFFYSLKKMFNVSNVSQFAEEYNPISKLTQIRRISADRLKISNGASKNSRNRSDGVRDVQQSEFGSICPIQASEGQNIGLVKGMALFAKISPEGIFEVPYYQVKNGIVDTSSIVYLNSIQERKHIITTTEFVDVIDGVWKIKDLPQIETRMKGTFGVCAPNQIQLVTLSPSQMVSVGTAGLPFLENNDAFRALPGTNMFRQSVPLLFPEAAFVAAGIEALIARSLPGVIITAEQDGEVKLVDARYIVVCTNIKDKEIQDINEIVKIYELKKFERTNQNTIINHRAIVKVGDKVKKGDVLADGSCTDKGELSVGVNACVAFVSGPDVFEDAFLLSERFAHVLDKLTSLHIMEFEVSARDTKLGEETFTRDIPGVPQEAIAQLDEEGIIIVGSRVKRGTILVGKASYNNPNSLDASRRLVGALHKNKSVETKDCSFRAPPGANGIVTKVTVIQGTKTNDKERITLNEMKSIQNAEYIFKEKSRLLREGLYHSLIDTDTGDNTSNMSSTGFNFGSKMKNSIDKQIKAWEEEKNNEILSISKGSDLPANTMKIVKIQIIEMRKIAPGDKLCGRHGNKGVVKQIARTEDMPYLSNGTPVDMLINPISLTARMNLGQMWETHLGLACYMIGAKLKQILHSYKGKSIKFDELTEFIKKATTIDITKLKDIEVVNFLQNITMGFYVTVPPFEGPDADTIGDLLELGGCDRSGDVTLYDGKTGELIGTQMCVGYQYINKLFHMAVDKKKMRSVGAYSAIFQQPVESGIKHGQMEGWAMQAHGAAEALLEVSTMKSDAAVSRQKIFEAITTGSYESYAGVSRSLEVFIRRINALGVNVIVTEEGDPFNKKLFNNK